MSTLFLPWNHRPSSTSSVQTGTYSIPAGKYARVTFLNNSTACSIDGNTVIPVNVDETTAGGGQVVATNHVCLVRYHLHCNSSNGAGAGSASVSVGSKSAQVSCTSLAGESTVTSTNGEFIGQSGETVTASATSGSAVAQLDYFTPARKEYWVQSGVDVIGGLYYVEEYDVP